MNCLPSHHLFSRLVAVLAVYVGVVNVALADGQGVPPDKSSYNLFNPTPRELMRDLSADRPDGTESPKTVDAGHYQVEASVFDFTREDEDGVETDSWAVFDTNIKFGLNNDTELQVIFAAYQEEEADPDAGPSETLDGFADVTVRLKVNLWGNDSGETAFALMPFIKFPTGSKLSNGRLEGGLIAMLGWDVAETWGLGFMIEVDAVYDEEGDNYDAEIVHTAVFGTDLVGDLGGYVEYIGVITTDGASDYRAIFSTGLTYSLSADLVLDVGTQLGLNDAADDERFFVGFTYRH